MIPFKTFLTEETHTLYHVTSTSDVPKIMKLGLLPNKSKNGFTFNKFGGRLSKKGFIYAFEHLNDAVGWVFKQSWEISKGKDWSMFTIIKFNDDKEEYVQDTHHESMGGRGKWLMKQGSIPPEKLTVLPPLQTSLGRLLVADKEVTEDEIDKAYDLYADPRN